MIFFKKRFRGPEDPDEVFKQELIRSFVIPIGLIIAVVIIAALAK